MKQIIVDCCNNCPYHEGMLCMASPEMDDKMGDGTAFPDGCPLKDYNAKD